MSASGGIGDEKSSKRGNFSSYLIRSTVVLGSLAALITSAYFTDKQKERDIEIAAATRIVSSTTFPIDLNGDGLEDLVVRNRFGSDVAVLMKERDGNYTVLSDYLERMGESERQETWNDIYRVLSGR